LPNPQFLPYQVEFFVRRPERARKQVLTDYRDFFNVIFSMLTSLKHLAQHRHHHGHTLRLLRCA
jgi:hypothetical protein